MKTKGLPIGAKIFGIAIVLVCLMVALSTASIILFDRVRHELEVQNEVFLPTLNYVSRIESSVLSTEVLMETVRADQSADQGTEQEIGELAVDFLDFRKDLEERLTSIQTIVQSRPLDWYSRDSLVAVTRIDAAIDTIQIEHQDFYQEIGRFVDALRAGNSQEALNADAMIVEEARELAVQLEHLRSFILNYIETAVDQVVEYDIWLDRIIMTLTVLAVLLGVLVSIVITRGVVNPVKRLVHGMHEVRDGDLDVSVEPTTKDEIAWLSEGFNDMVEGLRAKERITQTFGKYVDSRVVENMIGNPLMTKPGGDRRDMTIFFSDMAGFTKLSERLTPENVLNLLNAYFTTMSKPIRNHEGVIDKFIGDAIMAYWGPPFVAPETKASAACETALEQLALLQGFKHEVGDVLGLRRDLPDIRIRIGIATGPAVVGTVGSSHHHNYTVLGDTVNLAARLESGSESYRVPCLVDKATRDDAMNRIVFREIDSLRVKGRMEPVRIYQPLGMQEADSAVRRLAKDFEKGLAAYRRRDFETAIAAFKTCLEAFPDDGPSAIFLDRIEMLKNDMPPADWDGVWVMDSK